MIKIFLSPSCASCRKAKAFFEKLHIPHKIIDITAGDLTKEDLIDILKFSENGTDDLISPRSKIVKEQNIDFSSMTLNELLDFVIAHPTVMRRPIIIDDRKMEVGYDPYEITAFMPKEFKELLDNCENCPLSADCDIAKAIEEAKESILKKNK